MTGLNPPQSPVRFRLATSLLRASHARAILLLVLLLPVLMLLPFLFVAPESDATITERLAVLVDGVLNETETRQLAWSLAVLLPLTVAFLTGQRQAWLRLDSSGIECHLPRWLGLGLVRQTAGHWRLGWGDIRHLRLEGPDARHLKKMQQLNAHRLVFSTPKGEYRVSPFQWFDPQQDHRLGLGEIRGGKKIVDAHAILRRAPLFNYLEPSAAAESGETVSTGPQAFDLASHKGMLTQLTVMAGAGGYALVDGLFLGQWQPLEALPVWPFVLVAAGAAAMIPRLGQGVPRAERLTVGALAVAALVAAVYPGLLRYNAATAQPQLVHFEATAPGVFSDPADQFPVIDLSGKGIPEYWQQYPPGSEHEFRLLHGDAGFVQMDLTHFYGRTQDFYEDQG